MTIVVLASFYPKPDKVDEVETILKGMVGPTRNEPGCRTYNLHRWSEGGISFHIYEVYDAQSDVEFHRSMDYYKQYRAAIPDLLAKPIEVKIMDALDVKTD
ncbi:MAG TPA: putative quinol monooxygenase [Alphaproteobacteria bacterium]|nr:putative quinol monooxygenase [Alphaproteobacteria bacterium]